MLTSPACCCALSLCHVGEFRRIRGLERFCESRMQSLCLARCIRSLWAPAQTNLLLKLGKVQKYVNCQLQHSKTMENKPWALISEIGALGYPEELIDIMMKRFHVVSHKDFLQNLQLYSPKVQVLFCWNTSPTVEPSLLRLLPSLKVVANGGAGINHLDVPYINSLGVKVTNTPGVVSSATADIALGLLLASARDIITSHQIAVDPNTTSLPTSMMGVDVTGSTMGIVGMGDIGYKIAQRGRGFEMKILYYNRRRRNVKEEQAVGARYCQSLDELLKDSDFVVLAVNLTPETTGLIGHRELSLMRSTATLVNISRGGRSGRFSRRPPVRNHPWRRFRCDLS
ncbi:uncharacterized protein isoform X3 [Takifugu rubripes]|uniref:uncharacterized protein isoform X3 n=1 Tax=Takifugu rubripes TaxID=31033 RepID=UPI001145FCCA|nr:uncharacterized protein LOC101073228 isoform X3 [Takifugu rubripes]XP_029701312.1 uncharacterized protein LOC101073228 isoform X3 [Takifugu rubripes]